MSEKMWGIWILGKKYRIDEEGYMYTRKRWFSEWGTERGKQLGIELTEEHWVVIDYVREYTKEHGIAPILLIACKTLGIHRSRMTELFGEKPMKNVCKIAGLERPTGCA